MEKANGCNSAWCIQPSKNEAKVINCKGFILPSCATIRNNEYIFERNHILAIDTDLQELCCPSKFKKLGSNPDSSNSKRKNLVRSKMQYSIYLKNRSIYTFSAFDKNQKESLLDHLNFFSH